jgi:moderate conductance mechanosensitive channel
VSLTAHTGAHAVWRLRPHAVWRLRAVACLARAAALLIATLLAGLPAIAPAEAQAPGLPVPAADAAPPADEPSVAEALRLLAIVLKDPDARAALVAQLREVEPDAPDAPQPAIDPEILLDPTVAQAIAEQTLGLAEGLGDQVRGVLRDLFAVAEILEFGREYDLREDWAELAPVVIVIVAVILAIWILRLATRPMLSRFEGSAVAAETALAPLRWKFFALLVEVARVVIAWGIGFAVAFFVSDGDLPLEVGIFLSAFIWVEAARALLRVVLRPLHPELRMIRMNDAMARHWSFWLARIIGILGYGILFLAPLAYRLGSDRLADWLMLAAAMVAMAMGTVLILRNRTPVREGLQLRLAHAPDDMIVTWLSPLASYWHLIAMGYILALFVVWRAVPGEALAFMVRATLSSALVILIGSLLIAFITRSIADGIRLDERTRASYPTLEDRLNRFVPAALQVARVVSALVVLALILTFWGIFDAVAWLGSPAGQTIVWSFLWISTVLLLAGGAYIAVASWVEYRLNPDIGAAPTPRERTLLALFSNAFVIVLAIITAMTVLHELGINIAPLIAGAGVVGLAIGFGAQKLVQDIINGAFIQFENTMNEGDIVTAGAITGVVEKLTIRSVSLRDVSGRYHMIPFSGVDTVTNFSKTFSYHVADIGVAYRENLAEVQAAMQEAFDRLMETEHRAEILPPFEQFGIDQFADSAIVVRGRIKTLPGKQWGVGRAYNGFIKEVFDERGIEIPFPHRTLYMGVDKDGTAPPLPIRTERPRRALPPREDEPRRHERGGNPGSQPSDLALLDPDLTPPAPEDV